MALTFPRDPFLELYLPGLGWVDVTDYVRQVEPVTVTRGSMGEQDGLAPCRLELVLNDHDRKFDPEDVLGEWYGLIGPGVPVRWGFWVVRDTFTRNVADGLGSTDTGEAYTLDGTAADFDVLSTTASVSIAAASTARQAYLAYLTPFADYEVGVDVTIPHPNGDSNSAGVILRGASPTSASRCSVNVASSGQVTLNLTDRAGNLAGSVVPVGPNTGAYRVRALVEGETLRGQAWRTSDVQPLGWHSSVNVTPMDMNTSGWAGLRARTGLGASNVTFALDNFQVRIIRFSGELTDLVPQVDKSHRGRTTRLLASGVTRRLTQGRPRPLRSAFRRYVERSSPGPTAYWAMDDEQNSEAVKLTRGSGQDARVSDTASLAPIATFPTVSPARMCGRGAVAPWFGPSLLVKPVSFVIMQPTSIAGLSNPGWRAHLVVTFDGPYSGSGGFANALDGVTVNVSSRDYTLSSEPDAWGCSLNSFNGNVVLSRPDGGSSGSVSGGDLFDGNPHVITMSAIPVNSQQDTQVTLFVDGVSLVSLTQSTLGNTYPTTIAWFSIGEDSKPRSLGGCAVYQHPGPSLPELVAAMRGHAGEAGGLRMQRLSGQERVPFEYAGDLTVTTAMGPQYAEDHLVGQMAECAATDQGRDYEPRSVAGFGYRTRQHVEGQPVVAELDYAAAEVFELVPVTGDRATRNLITAKRRDGGDFTVEQLSGPKNTADPGTAVGAVGVYDVPVPVNTQDDALLRDVANRALARGTSPEPRYRALTVTLHGPNVFNPAAPDPALTADLLDLDVGDRFRVLNLQTRGQYDPADQLLRGYVEVLRNVRLHEITINSEPYAPYRVFVLDSDRLDSLSSTLAAQVAAGLALPYTISVATSNPMDLWTTSGAEFPFDVMIAGQRLTISGITGATSPQTFTVSARANGVDKAQVAGALVGLADPARLG